jgi:hypothetical protein
MSRVRTLGVLLAVLFVPAIGSSQRPLPEADAFFVETRQNLARSDREQHRYAYKERRTELHMNPFGRLGTGGMQLFEVTPGREPGVYHRRLLERDGKPVPAAKPEETRRRSRPQGRSTMEDVVATLRFAIDRREPVDGRDAIVVRFEPRPGANPQTREGRMARAFKGVIWVNEQAREVIRVEAVAIENLSYGLGVIARLGEGTSVKLTRERIDDHVWLPTSIHFKGTGRALLVRKLNIDFGVEWFDYRRIADVVPAPESR